MKNALLILGALVFLPGFRAVAAENKGDFDVLRQRLVEYYAGGDTGEALQYMRQQGNDGSWGDIDYVSKQRSRWPAYYHVQRLGTMAAAYRGDDPRAAGNAELKTAIELGLDHWYEHDYRNPNWWFQSIGVPREICSIMVLMKNELTPERLDNGLAILRQAKIERTGQNKVWEAGITAVRGAIEEDDALVEAALDAVLEELRVSGEEGIQPDWTFHQHGPQLQFGNYGASFLSDMLRWGHLVRGTRWELTPEQIKLLRNYVLEGQRWVLWRGIMDFAACGRQFRGGDPTSKCRTIVQAAEALALLDPEMQRAYDAMVRANTDQRDAPNRILGNRNFWRSDVMIHQTAEAHFSIKCCSERVAGAESCNGDNLQGYHMGDGMTLVYQSGGEYEEIYPFWDWRKVPGVTALQGGEPLPVLTSSGYRNGSDYVGGVSDGRDGAMAMDYNRDGLEGAKGWFFSGNTLVCLGAGFHTDKERAVCTGVNQCLLKGPVSICTADKTATEERGQREYSGLEWLHHDSVGYVFLEPMDVTVESGEMTGSWSTCYSSSSERIIKEDVLRVWIDHGVQPQDAGYAYMILADASADEAAARAKNPGMRVLENTAALQAVHFEEAELTQALFREPGACVLPDGSALQVDAPCAVMLRKQGGKLELTVADPAQQLESCVVTVPGRFPGEGRRVNAQANTSAVTVLLPQDLEAGRSVVMH